MSLYKVGGSLRYDDQNYVERRADSELYRTLKASEFCYVFNSRQMGKSSLLVRTRHRLQLEGYSCTCVDLTQIGSENITPQQWYKGLVVRLLHGFNLVGFVNFKAWWQEHEDLSLLQRLSQFIEEVLLVNIPNEQIFIFIDEIDSILSLNFSVDDFFALIRFCYNQRAHNSEYSRLTWALFGVATPADLIGDKKRTPFNIGTAIELSGFQLQEAQPLMKGLEGQVSNFQAIFREIMAWTAGQPFLTQKLCQLVVRATQETQNNSFMPPPGTEIFWVENLVRDRLIDYWESLDEPEHLRTVRDRLLRNEQRAGGLLGVYQQLLQGVEIRVDDSQKQTELLLSGLVVKQQGYLQIKNRIYREVFCFEWVERQLQNLRPYSQLFDGWVASYQQDKSRLLRGQALIDAQLWSDGKSLSDLDYKFLAASTELDRLEVQLGLEAERTQFVEARLVLEKKAAKRQRILLIGVTIALLLACFLGGTTYFQYRSSVTSEHLARISEIKAVVSSSEGLFASNRRLDGLVEAIKATKKLQLVNISDPNIKNQVKNALAQAVYGADEYNRLSGHQAAILAVDISPDSSVIASASADNTVKLWRRDGTLLKTLLGHTAPVRAVSYSPDGKTLVSASDDRTVKIWQQDGEPALKTGFPPVAPGDSEALASLRPRGDAKGERASPRRGKLLKTLTGHNAPIWVVTFSPDGQQIVSASMDSTIKIWQRSGKLLKTFQGHLGGVYGLAFSPDSQIFVTAGLDNMLKFWQRSGQLLRTIHNAGQNTRLAFSPDGKMIASSSSDNTVKLWTQDGTLLKTFHGHTAIVTGVAFSPDGQQIASSSMDKTIKIWHINGSELATFRGHSSQVWGLAWSHDGSFIASAGTDNFVRLWQSHNPLLSSITAHENGIYGLDISSDSTTIATAGSGQDNTVKLWDRQGKLLETFVGHKAPVISVDISPDGKLIASASLDTTVKLWQRDGDPDRSSYEGNPPKETAVLKTGFPHVATGVSAVRVRAASPRWRSGDRRTRGTLVRTFSGFHAMVTSVAFSPQGNILAASSQDDTLKLWKLDGEPALKTGFPPVAPG